MAVSVRLPALLDAGLTEKARLQPTACSVTLNMTGTSQASMTLTEADAGVQIHDWVSIYTQNGLAGVFRVSNIAQTYTQQVQVTLLHGIDILNDSVWAEQREFSGTMTQYLTALLNQQTHLVNGVKPWVLGTCADTSTVEKSINHERLMDLFSALEEEGSEFRFVYDQSSFPWTVSLVRKEAAVSSEFRLTRNVHTASVTFNDADLCTRLILSVNIPETTGTGDAQSTTNKVFLRTYDNATAQAAWGIVTKVADIDTTDNYEEEDFSQADAWAQTFLAQRAAPSVQIQIDGEELAGLTGFAWDSYSVGKLCRVALPVYGKTFEERAVSIVYPDVLGEPTHVTVSLANALPKFSETIASLSTDAAKTASAVRGIGRSAASATQMREWSQIVQYQGLALDGTGVTTLYESGIDMSATGGVKIYSLQQGLQALYGGIEVASDHITSTVSATGLVWDDQQGKYVLDPNAAQGSLYNLTSSVKQTADAVTTEVTAARDGKTSLAGRLTVMSDAITAEVSRAQGAEGSLSSALQLKADSATLISQINNSSESTPIAYGKVQMRPGHVLIEAINDDNTSTITLAANRINVQGIVTALSSYSLGCENINVGDHINTSSLHSDTEIVCEDTIWTNGLMIGGASGQTRYSVDPDGLIASISDGVEGTGADAGKIICTYTMLDGTTTGTFSFDIAATQTYRAGVAAVTVDSYSALAPATSTGASMSSTVTLTNSNTDTITITGGISGRNTSTVTAPVYSTSTGNYSYYPYVTLNGGSRAYLRQASFSGSAAREDGWNGAAGTVVTPTAAGTGAYIDVTYPVTYSSSSGTNTGTRRYTLEADQSAGYTYLTTGSGSSKKNVARVAIPSSSKSISSVTAATPTYASNVYTVPLDVTYDDGTTERAYVTLNFSISNWQSGGTYGTYTINLHGNSARTLSPSGAYGAGQNSVTLQSLKHLKTVYSGSIQTQYKLSNGKQSTMSSSAVTQFDP